MNACKNDINSQLDKIFAEKGTDAKQDNTQAGENLANGTDSPLLDDFSLALSGEKGVLNSSTDSSSPDFSLQLSEDSQDADEDESDGDGLPERGFRQKKIGLTSKEGKHDEFAVPPIPKLIERPDCWLNNSRKSRRYFSPPPPFR